MKVLDATYLVDYLDGHEATSEFYEEHRGEHARWVIPVPAYAEVLVGRGNLPSGDVEAARTHLEWAEKYAVDEETAVLAGEIADEVAADGPHLDGPDALIAAVGRQLDAPVVSADADFTHPETKAVVDVEEYR